MASEEHRTWIKLCGTTSLHDAQLGADAGADALGFIFAPSPRRIDPAAAAEIVAGLPAKIETIGVFVNETPQRVAEIVEQVGLSGVQLHGDETDDVWPEFRRLLDGRRIIKTLQARLLTEGGPRRLGNYVLSECGIDAILLDSGTVGNRGGTGNKFDWHAVQDFACRIRETMPVIVAGGLNSENVVEALRVFQPWGVDVVSGVESAAGRKDETKIREFVAVVRRTGIATK